MSRNTKKKNRCDSGQVIAVGNQKGGVGKTAVTVNLAAALGEQGRRVLVLDLDPSSGATHHLGVDPFAYEGSVELLTTDAAIESLAISEDLPEGVELIASRSDMAAAGVIDLAKLRGKLVKARDVYDFILLDTPPNPKSPCTFAAYAVADWFLFVSSPQVLSVRGLSEAIRDVASIRQGPNRGLEVLGVVFNAVDTRTLAVRDTEAFIDRHKDLRPFTRSPFIPASVDVNRAAEQGRALHQVKSLRYKPVTLCFDDLASEIAERCANREAFLAGAKAGRTSSSRRSA